MQNKDKVWISAAVPKSLKDQMRKISKQKRWSMNTFIEEAISNAISDFRSHESH